MTFKYIIVKRLAKKVVTIKDNFEDAQKFVLSQKRGNQNKTFLILKWRV
ncbi:hypothetical protein I6E17_03720 [Fusobacterium perfoetens]|nr:hypothetical protein [Fusobacterium perfoetens]MCF2625289.1 hypothetical protein [Fusobacterium perfoetens]